jgi:hypothetical protein
MSHLCPNCGGSFWNAGTRFLARPATSKWYSYSAPIHFCPRCRVDLRKTVRPLGRGLVVLMTLALSVYLLYWFLHPQQLLRHGFLAPLGIPLIGLPFALCYAIWGVTYVRSLNSAADRANVAL